MSKDLKLFYEDTDGMKVYSANGGSHQLKDIDATTLKKLTALEIIKEKKVNMLSLLSSIEWFNPSHYNDSVGCPVGCELTQQEYDLLKEVLL